MKITYNNNNDDDDKINLHNLIICYKSLKYCQKKNIFIGEEHERGKQCELMWMN